MKLMTLQNLFLLLGIGFTAVSAVAIYLLMTADHPSSVLTWVTLIMALPYALVSFGGAAKLHHGAHHRPDA